MNYRDQEAKSMKGINTQHREKPGSNPGFSHKQWV